MNSERLIGLAYTCERFHSGQWSRGYRLLCKINFKPGSNAAWHLKPNDEWDEARDWAVHYIKLVRTNMINL